VISGPGGAKLASFRAMANPWEVQVAGADAGELMRVAAVVAAEVRRIEHKYSRYRNDGIVHRLNTAQGAAVEVDEETARLLDYAQQLWALSDGRFDITTGALRRVWTFDRSNRIPDQAAIDAVLPYVGWGKLRWNRPRVQMPTGMEIDFGGIGKEYAVDRALLLAHAQTSKPLLVNGGGDIAANAPPAADQAWRIGIVSDAGAATPALKLQRGAAATSGDAHRYLLKDGVRYSHILDPRSGWPVPDAPQSVTVLAASCSEAGSHSTIALLHGASAENYLASAGVDHWVQRAAQPGEIRKAPVDAA